MIESRLWSKLVHVPWSRGVSVILVLMIAALASLSVKEAAWTSDRNAHVAALWKHWGRCDIHWFQGSHLSSFTEPSVRRYTDDVLRRALPL